MMKNGLLVTLAIISLFFTVFPTSFVNAESLICGDGFCNLERGESWQNCPQDCIKEENPEEIRSLEEQKNQDNANIKPSRILPKALQREEYKLFFIIPILLVLIFPLVMLFSNTKIASRTIKEYLLPIKYYVLGAVLIVISQYVVGLNYDIPYYLNITQALWITMIILSLIKLIGIYKAFNILNLLVLGILYSAIIHGLKLSIRYFFYNKPAWYLIDRFFYGSFLAIVTVIIVGSLLLYLKKKNLIEN